MSEHTCNCNHTNLLAEEILDATTIPHTFRHAAILGALAATPVAPMAAAVATAATTLISFLRTLITSFPLRTSKHRWYRDELTVAWGKTFSPAGRAGRPW